MCSVSKYLVHECPLLSPLAGSYVAYHCSAWLFPPAPPTAHSPLELVAYSFPWQNAARSNRLAAERMPTSLRSPTSSFPSPSHKAGSSMTIYQAWRPTEENHSRIKVGCWNTAFYGPISIVQARAQKILNHSPKRAQSTCPSSYACTPAIRTTQERVPLHTCIAQPFTNFL